MQQVGESSGTPTHVSRQTGVLVKHREIQVSSSPSGYSPLPSSSLAAMSLSNAKPIPAPRRKADNSVRAKPPSNNNRKLDDEIGEIRFDDDSRSVSASAAHNKPESRTSEDTNARVEARSTSRKAAHIKNRGRSISADVDVRTANIKRSMDELRKKEENENEITKDLEKQLAEIRRMEEKQRNILQNTLRQVVHSVNDSQLNTHSTAQKDEIQMDRIDCSSLLSPSFNRKTPLNSPLMNQRSTASPQSPRKLSSSGRRQDMQTINENGSYSLTEVAAMSPASSHRTLSSMASPLLSGRSDISPLSGHTLSSRQSPGGLGDPFLDKNFRLSASYTELPPQPGGDDRSGYFSDRELDRRRGGDELKNYTDEARRALLQFEIEKRRKQVEENNQLRSELQRLIQSGSIPAAKYGRLREMYKDHINRSREYLGLSNSSLSSISTTGRNVRLGYDGFTTDSDYTSSTEHLAGNISQSSTIERLRQSNDNLYKQTAAAKAAYASNHSLRVPADTSTSKDEQISSNRIVQSASAPTGQRNGENLPAMPLLDIRAPKSTTSASNSTCELVKIGKSPLLIVIYKIQLNLFL